MLTGGDKATRDQLKRIHGSIRILIKQIYGHDSPALMRDFKLYIKLLACEEGYPYKIEGGQIIPKSFGEATQSEANIINMVINVFADERNLVLIQTDEVGNYPSLGGRDRDTMIDEHPEIFEKYYGET